MPAVHGQREDAQTQNDSRQSHQNTLRKETYSRCEVMRRPDITAFRGLSTHTPPQPFVTSPAAFSLLTSSRVSGERTAINQHRNKADSSLIYQRNLRPLTISWTWLGSGVAEAVLESDKHWAASFIHHVLN